jgi:hypothetical protein
VGDADDIEMHVMKQKQNTIKKKVSKPRYRTRVTDCDDDEF